MDGESLPHFPNELYVVSAVITSMRETVLPSATSSADHSASHRLLWQAKCSFRLVRQTQIGLRALGKGGRERTSRC
jgi:hypothetical protein